MRPDNYNQIWSDMNKDSYPAEVIARVNGFINFTEERLRKIMTWGTVADLGAGNGYIANAICKTIFPYSGKKAIDKYDYYPTGDTTFCDLRSPPDEGQTKYPAVYMSHVLEHIDAPGIEVIENIKNYWLDLPKVLIIAVPDANYDTGHRPFDKSIGHVQSYTSYCLAEIFDKLNAKEYNIQLARTGIYEGFEEIWASVRF